MKSKRDVLFKRFFALHILKHLNFQAGEPKGLTGTGFSQKEGGGKLLFFGLGFGLKPGFVLLCFPCAKVW